MAQIVDHLGRLLLDWYDRARRDLPWRPQPGEPVDPYRTWISEIMLQQTTAAAVAPRFRAFIERWPQIEALAAEDLDAVLHEWQGLGYYARARNLHACARVIVGRHAGRLPDEEHLLRALPGIGAYTAAAIAAIAFGRKATAVDGNVLRVVSRLHGVETPLPAARAELARLAAALTPQERPGDFAQGMMDLGATVCRPRQPGCSACPWRLHCAAFATGRPEGYPRRAATGEKPWRYGAVFWTERADGAVLLRKRPAEGLLGGMMEFPSTPWRGQPWAEDEAVGQAPAAGPWSAAMGAVRHTFTHFHLHLDVFCARQQTSHRLPEALWCVPEGFCDLALPTLMKKVGALVQAAAGELQLPAAPYPRGRIPAQARRRRQRAS